MLYVCTIGFEPGKENSFLLGSENLAVFGEWKYDEPRNDGNEYGEGSFDNENPVMVRFESSGY